MSTAGRIAVALGVIAACGCSEPPAPVPEPEPPSPPAIEPESPERELDVPAVFHAAYHRDAVVDARFAARERIRALSARHAIPQLVRVAAEGGREWDEDAAIRDIGSFKWDARPWIDDVVTLSDDHSRPACRALVLMGGPGRRKVALAAHGGRTSGHRATALDVLAVYALPEPELRHLGLSLLRSPTPKVARAAARLVVVHYVHTGDELRDIDRALRVSDETRAETLLALSRFGDRASGVAPVLIRRVHGEGQFEHGERMRAAEILAEMESRRDEVLRTFQDALLREPEELLGLARMIAGLHPDAFVDGITEGPVATRRAYAWCAYPGDVDARSRPAIVDALVTALSRTGSHLPGVAALSLARFEDVPDAAVEPLSALVRDTTEQPRWRIAALHALARTEAAGRTALTPIVDDESLTFVLRERAAHLL